jgi:hypothetical protein
VGILCSSLNAYEYVYPVGTFIDYEGETCVLSLYQKTPDHTELWQSNMGTHEPFVTHEVNRALLSTFTPVGVAMLPDNAGFSFFDNGRLRIKNFLKRSPKAIDIYEPIYDIGPLQWVTTDVCIFHAKEREEFSLYQLCASDGSVTKIVSREAFDCFYPSQVGDALFFIEHTSTGDYSIICRSQGRQYCLVTHDRPLACLSMVDKHEGIVIEHQVDVNRQKDTVLACACYQVTCADSFDSASLVKLFSFTLPLSLLLDSSKARLCESLYPLLPRKIGQAIYFVSCVDDILRPFCYTDSAGVQPLPFEAQPFGDLFTPLSFAVHESFQQKSSLIMSSSQAKVQSFIYGGSLQRELLHDDQEPAEALILVTL